MDDDLIRSQCLLNTHEVGAARSAVHTLPFLPQKNSAKADVVGFRERFRAASEKRPFPQSQSPLSLRKTPDSSSQPEEFKTGHPKLVARLSEPDAMKVLPFAVLG